MATEAPFTGLTASVKLGTELLGYISGVNLNLSTDIIEILAFGHKYKEKIPSIKDWSASVDGTAAFVTGGSQQKLLKAFEDSTKMEIDIFLDAETHFKGSAYVGSLEISTTPDDKTNITCELAGTDAVTSTIGASPTDPSKTSADKSGSLPA